MAAIDYKPANEESQAFMVKVPFRTGEWATDAHIIGVGK
jgi:hypothetical protein